MFVSIQYPFATAYSHDPHSVSCHIISRFLPTCYLFAAGYIHIRPFFFTSDYWVLRLTHELASGSVSYLSIYYLPLTYGLP